MDREAVIRELEELYCLSTSSITHNNPTIKWLIDYLKLPTTEINDGLKKEEIEYLKSNVKWKCDKCRHLSIFHHSSQEGRYLETNCCVPGCNCKESQDEGWL